MRAAFAIPEVDAALKSAGDHSMIVPGRRLELTSIDGATMAVCTYHKESGNPVILSYAGDDGKTLARRFQLTFAPKTIDFDSGGLIGFEVTARV